MVQEVVTYRDLLAALQTLSESQLSQVVQIADPPNDCSPVELASGLAIGTVGGFEFEGARSVVDNRYHAEEVVILIDGNPFAEDGAHSYRLEQSGPEEKPLMRHIPIYGKDGVTPREAQLAPSVREDEFPRHLATVVNHRATDMQSRSGP